MSGLKPWASYAHTHKLKAHPNSPDEAWGAVLYWRQLAITAAVWCLAH